MTQKRQLVGPPFLGAKSELPPPYGPPSAFDDVLNWFCRKNRIHTRPRLNAFGAPPDGAIVRDMLTFDDVLNNPHTLVLTTKNAYMLTAGPTWNLLTYPVFANGGTDLTGTALPYGRVSALNKTYFSNGSHQVLYADGESSLKISGATAPAAKFLTINAAHLIAAYITDPEPGAAGSKTYPQRVAWSKTGDPTVWSGAFSAGLADLIEVKDSITGLMTLGRNTFVWRNNGITVMYPTGIGLQPFNFEHLSYAEHGIGTKYSHALATYTDRGVGVADDDIYILDRGGNFSPIGGLHKKRIFSDLEQATGDVVTGTIVAQLAPNFDMLSYWLSIPGVDVTWVFIYETGAWQRFTSVSGRLTAMNLVRV